MRIASRRLQQWLPLIVAILVVGCSSEDQRLVDLSRQSADRQAEQNRLVEANNRQVIDATQRLVEADAQTRRESIRLQHEIQTEQAGINQQRDALEQERRQIADQRNRDPIVAELIQAAVGLIVAALPLVACLFVLRGLFHKSDDEAMVDVMIEELLTQEPLLAKATGLLQSPTEIQALPLAPTTSVERLAFQENSPAKTSADASAICAVVVEGINDIEFLSRICRILRKHDSTLPDLRELESQKRIVFLTANSGLLVSMATTNVAGGPLFYLLDREIPPVSQERQHVVGLLNQRPGCRAVLTAKRAMENYLHPAAVWEAGGVEVKFGDFDEVAEAVAKTTFSRDTTGSWETLSRRGRRRLRDKAKKWLNRDAVDRMTPERLGERDPDGEVIGWLRTIAELTTSPIAAAV